MPRKEPRSVSPPSIRAIRMGGGALSGRISINCELFVRSSGGAAADADDAAMQAKPEMAARREIPAALIFSPARTARRPLPLKLPPSFLQQDIP